MQNIVDTANSLMSNHTKTELVPMARHFGWRGDHARAPMLQLALFIASKLASGEQLPSMESDMQAGGSGESKKFEESNDGGQSGKNQQTESQQEGNGQESNGAGSEQSEGNGQESPPMGSTMGDKGQEQQENENGSNGQESTPSENGQNQQQLPPMPEPDQNEKPGEDSSDEFRKLLAASRIAKPHRMLEKVWRLTVKARRNVALVGPAASGKTMLAEQLAQLINVPFAAASCSEGMSETHLLGRLLPTGKKGKMEYSASPMIECMGKPSVFLLDEMDRGDANCFCVTNSLFSNGYVFVPYKLDSHRVDKHADSIVIAGMNATGGSDLYAASNILDGAFLDRFYLVEIDYDLAFIKSLFQTGKAPRKSAPWKAAAVPTDVEIAALGDWVLTMIEMVKSKGIRRIVGTRFAQNAVAALRAGIPVEEIKADLTMGWSADEKRRAGVVGV